MTPRAWEGAAGQMLLEAARPFNVRSRGMVLHAWHWSAGANRLGRTVLLAHGWSARAVQFEALIWKLTDNGFDVVSFNAPGHGASDGVRPTLLDFAGAIRAVMNQVGTVDAVIGHSMGAAASVLALREGEPVDRVVLISTPNNLESTVHDFARLFSLRKEVVESMLARLQKRLGVNFETLHLVNVVPSFRTPALLIHDKQDRELSYLHSARTADAWPASRLVLTDGLGHSRILKDATVLEEITAFLKEMGAREESVRAMRDPQMESVLERFVSQLTPTQFGI